MGVKTVVEKENKNSGEDVVCTACELTVPWVQNQLKQNITIERVYVTQLYESILYLMGESVYDYNNDANMPNWTFTIGEKPFTLTLSRILGDIIIEVCRTVSDSGNLQLRFAEAAEQASRVQNHVLEILFSTLFG